MNVKSWLDLPNLSDLNIEHKDKKISRCSLFSFRKQPEVFCSKAKINFFKTIFCVVFPKLTEILTLLKVQNKSL